MKSLRERWHGLTVLGVVAFAAACMTVAPAPSFADIAGGGGGGGPITEWCSDGRPKTGLVRCEDGNLRYFDPELAPWSRTSGITNTKLSGTILALTGPRCRAGSLSVGTSITSIPKTMIWHTAEFRLTARTTS